MGKGKKVVSGVPKVSVSVLIIKNAYACFLYVGAVYILDIDR